MRPTGELHLGNYFGALRNWIELQDKYDCFFMVADIHALMSESADSRRIKQKTREMAADWIACGIDPSKATLFVQSEVPQHSELHLILSCITPLGWLERSPTYKDQIRELSDKDAANYAFLGYPVLQTADIVLYKGEYVPVGEDQVPHLELAREVVRRFHHVFKCDIFPEPQPLLTKWPKILGTDGVKKMSKSLNNYISCSEEQKTLQKKVLAMYTDPKRPRKEDPGHPEDCNVFSFHKLFGSTNTAKIETDCRNAVLGCVDCKKELLGHVESFAAPVREKRRRLLESGEVDEILRDGNRRAAEVAGKVMQEVTKAVFG